MTAIGTGTDRGRGALRRRGFIMAAGVAVALTAACLQPAAAADPPRTASFDLTAGRTGMVYRIHLAEPPEPAPPGGYPVLYALDGGVSVPVFQAIRAVMETGPVVVVGIGYPDDPASSVRRRYRDLTPPTPPALIPVKGSAPPPPTGGQDDFLAFIEEDLKPAIERRLPIDRRRQTLFGHSLGGLFTLHALFTRPDLFQVFAAAAPSVWWNQGSLLREQAAFLSGGMAPMETRTVLIEVARTPPKEEGGDREAGKWDHLRAGPTGIDIAHALHGKPGLLVMLREHPDLPHGGVLDHALADALFLTTGRLSPRAP